MHMPKNYRRFLLTAAGILSLILSMGSRATALAAPAGSDISVKMVANRGFVRPGQEITYTVTMKNLGPDDATFVDVGFQLPNELVMVSMQCDLGISPDTPFCEYSSLPAGSKVVSTMVATPKSGFHRRSFVTTVASISFEAVDSFDPNTKNNTTSVRTRLISRWPRQ